MVNSCPNKSHPDYKAMVTSFGEPVAMAIYVRNGEQIPDVSSYESLEAMKQAFFEETTEPQVPELIRRQRAALSDSLNVDVIMDATIDGAGQLETGAERPTIRVNPDYFSGDTLIHEYGHLYIDLLGGMSNSMIQQGRRYLKGTALEQEITDQYPELSGERLDKEILATAIGREGEKIFEENQTLAGRFKNWLDLFFNRLKQVLGLDVNVAKQLANELLSDQVRESFTSQLGEDIQKQKVNMKESDILTRRANLISKIKNGIQTKMARYNQIMNSSTLSDEKQKAIEKLKELVEEFGKKDDAEALTRYIGIGISETDKMKQFLQSVQQGEEEVTTRKLKAVHDYLQSYSHADEVRSLLSVDADLNGKLREGTLTNNEKTSLLDALDKLIHNYSDIQSMYRQQSKLLLADKFSKRDGRVHESYRERFRREFDKQSGRQRGLIRGNYYLNGEEVSKSEYDNAKREYVNEHMAENKPEIIERERQHWLELFELGPNDVGSLESGLMDPASINDDLIQVAHELFERADFRAMQDAVEKFKVADELFVRYEQEKPEANQKKKYNEIIEDEVDDNGQKTGKKSNYMVGPYYSRVYEINKSFYRQVDQARREGNEELASEIETQQLEWFKKNTRKVGGKYVPIKKWKNPQFKEIQKKIDSGSVVGEMYTHIMKLREDTDKKYPNRNSLSKQSLGTVFHRLPAMNSTNVERVIDKGFISTLKENLKDKFNIRVGDTDYRPEQVEEQDSDAERIGQETKRITKAMADESGGLQQTLPIYFRGDVQPSDQSFDMLSIHLLDNAMSTNYHEKHAIHADVEILKDISANRDVRKTKSTFSKGWSQLVNVFTGEDEAPITVKGENTEAHKALISLVESRLYGIKKLGDPKTNKWVDNILGWTGDVMLIGNWLSASANVMQGKTMNWIESVGGTDFTQGDLRTAEAKYWDDMIAWSKDFGRRRFYSKTNLLIEKYNALGDWSAVAERFVEDTRLKNKMKKSTLHGLNSMAEHYIQSTSMYAVLNAIKVKDKNGNFLTRDDDGKITTTDDINDAMSLDEAYEVKEGRLELIPQVKSTTNARDGSEINFSEQEEDISFLLRDINADLQGQYDSRQQSRASRTWYGRSFFVLRRWLPRGWMRRFRGNSTVGLDPDEIRMDERFYSRSRGEFKSGLYSDTFRLLWNKKYIETLKSDGVKASYELLKSNWNELSDQEYANVRRGVTEFAMMGLTLGAAAMLKGLADEEEDEYSKQGLYYLAFLSARLNSEMLFYVNPRETIRILRSPAASLSMIEATIHLMDQVAKDFPFTDMERYERGRRAGELKIEKDFEDIAPIFNQLNRNVEEALGWLYQETSI